MALAVALSSASTPTSFRAEERLPTLMERGQLRRAASVAEGRLQSQPDDVEALRVLATIRARQRRFDEATRLAERAVAAAPRNAAAHYALAEVCGARARSEPGKGRRRT